MYKFKSLCVSLLALTAMGLPMGARADSLTEALAYAYANNPTIASAFISIQSAKTSIQQERAALLPTVGGSAEFSAQVSDSPAGTQGSHNGSVGLSYNQTIFDNGATDAAVQAAQARYQAAIYAATNTEQNVLLNASTAFFNVILDSRVVSIRQENVGFVRAQVDAAQDRLDIGEGTRLEVSQAEARQAQAEANYQAAVNNLRTSEAAYQRFVGLAPSNLNSDIAFARLVPNSLAASIDRATAQHPALLASAAQIRAAQFDAESTEASFGPNISLSGSAGFSGVSTDNTVASARVGVSLNIPIYSPTREPSLTQANLGQIQSELEAFANRDQVVESVRQAWAGLNSSIAQIQSATAAVAASRLALDAVIDQNEVGQATTLDVLDARADLLTVEETLASAQAQRMIAGFSLIAATGDLTAEDLGLPVPIRAADADVAVSDSSSRPVAPQEVDAWDGLR